MVKLYVKYRIEIISAMLVSILLFIILIKLFTPITIDFFYKLCKLQNSKKVVRRLSGNICPGIV